MKKKNSSRRSRCRHKCFSSSGSRERTKAKSKTKTQEAKLINLSRIYLLTLIIIVAFACQTKPIKCLEQQTDFGEFRPPNNPFLDPFQSSSSANTDNQSSFSSLDYSALNWNGGFEDDDLVVEQAPDKSSGSGSSSGQFSDFGAVGRSLWRRQVLSEGSDLAGSSSNLIVDYDSYRSLLPLDTPTPEAYTRRFISGSDSSLSTAQLGSLSATTSNSQISSQKDLSLAQQQKSGPQFIKEPPSFIHYLNSSDLVIPCSASGNPQPLISWWHKSSQLEVGSLLNKRYVRYDNSLVISAFKAADFEPEIHSTTYKCQASNSLGTIVSRDVLINAVIEQHYEQEVSVADQFVSVDNDAIFKCQLAPQARDLFQVVGWLEDGQHLIQQVGQPTIVWWLAAQQASSGARANQLAHQQRTLVLPDGQLYIQRVQLKDTNKSYRCQIKNLLTGQISLSSLSGRLFVTDANEQSGTSPRIVDGPKSVSVAKLGDQLLLSCVAQGSPRPNIRWFRQKAQNLNQQQDSTGTPNEWLELQTNQQQQQHLNDSKYVISHEGNLLLIKSLQLSDNKARFKCLANNSFGAHLAETELKLDLYPASKLVEVEPKVEHINSIDLSGQQVLFNCTIRASSSPLVAIEWLKNGKLIFSISLAQFLNQNAALPTGQQFNINNHLLDFNVPILSAQFSQSLALNQNLSSMFDDPNQELSAIEFHQPSSWSMSQQQLNSAIQVLAGEDSTDFGANLNQQQQQQQQQQSPHESSIGDSSFSEQKQTSSNVILISTSLNKLSSESSVFNLNRHLVSSSPGSDSTTLQRHKRIRQSLKLINKDTLLYQLHLDQVKRSDRASYQCRARDLRTTFHATSQLMLKDNPPQFVETFSSQLLASKSLQVSLKCIASGSPLPEISWTLSGFPIPESSRFRVGDYVTRDGLIVSFVNISNVQVEDGGVYECNASNDVGLLKHSAWLNVTGPPFIRPMPNISAIAGYSVSIMCPVGGWPIEQISWFQNSTKLPLNHRQKLFPNGTLLISELNEVTDSGQYSCQAKGGQNSDIVALNHINIFIRVPPMVEPFSFAKSLHRGQRYNIMCTVVRGDLPVSIRWSKDGRPIEAAPVESSGTGLSTMQAINEQGLSEQHRQQQPQAIQANNNAGIAIKHLDPYSSTLTFASLQSHHRGVYTCDATNEAGRANQSSALVIHVPPEWRIEPKDISVTVGKTAVIDCQADAFPAARIEWRLSQDLFREPPTEFKPIISSLYMRVFENGSLIIYNTQRTDAGYYLCQANNGVGPGLSRVIKLTVHVAAHFKTKIRTELIRRGLSARLKCESIGDLPIEINWLRDKMPLYPSDESRYSISKTLLQDGIVSELHIVETDRQDSALFTCITQNGYGNDDTNIQLIVQAPPDQPLDIRIHEYEARSVRISWLPAYSGNSPILKYIIMYAQTSQPSLEMNSLPGTQLIDQQQAGVSSSSDIKRFAPAVNQYVNVSVGGNESSILLQNLTPLTEYQFYMFAINSIGSSRLPNEPIKFRTDDEAPSGPPLFVKATPTSSRSIRVKWRAPERRAHYGSISGFYVGYKPHKQVSTVSSSSNSDQTLRDTFIYKTVEFSYLTNNEQDNKNSSNLELDCSLLALRKGQKYLITVQAFNSRGAGPASEPIIVETWRIDVPDPPTLRMLMRTTHSIHLAWRLPTTSSNSLTNSVSATGPEVDSTTSSLANPLRPIQQAALLMRKNLHDHIKSHKQYDLASERSSFESTDSKKNLESGSNRYSTSSQMLNDDDNDETLDVAQANEPIVGFILTRRQMSPATTTATTTTPSTAQNSEPEGQPVEIRLPSDHLSQIVDNLTCGTRYQFSIVALNSVGASQPSDPLIVKTEGSTPVAPDKASLLSLNSSSLLINLAAWHNGACAMRSFDIMFKASRSKRWQPLTSYQVSPPTSSSHKEPRKSEQLASGSLNSTQADALSNNNNNNQLVQRSTLSQQQQQQQVSANSTIVLEDLSSAINYDLKIVATNEAGSTEALYTFNTNGGSLSLNRGEDQQWASGGEFQFSDTSLSELFSSSSPMLAWFFFLLFVSLTVSTGCILISKRRRAASSSCSLSLSSASRSNQSTSNYYTSNAANQLEASSSVAAAKGVNITSAVRCNTLGPATTGQKLRLAQHRDSDPSQLLLNGQNHNEQNVMQLGDIYGQHRQQQQQQQLQAQLNLAAEKSNYAYLSHQLRPSSPHNTDMSTVINGSEAEMCLGASALNISQQASEQAPEKTNKQRLEQNGGYYMTPANLLTLHASSKPAAVSGQQMMINKSSTLPANCHQQILHQLIQQQQQNETQQQNQQVIDNLLAANILQQQQQQQQQQQCNQEQVAYLSLQEAAANQSTSQENVQSINALLEQQLQQQVYATVKRGCPRPPRLCDYTIYQCPNNPDQQQQAVEGQQQISLLRCCAELPEGSPNHSQQQHICYLPAALEQAQQHQQICLQQQQVQASGYQQLRPIN